MDSGLCVMNEGTQGSLYIQKGVAQKHFRLTILGPTSS